MISNNFKKSLMKQLILFTFFLFILSTRLIAQNGEIYQIGDRNDFCAGDYSDKVEMYKARQQSQNWCWAACIQSVLKKQGLYIDQCDIVKQAFGQSTCVDRPADCYTISRAAGGWNINGRRIRAYMSNEITAHNLINDLAYKYPLIIGLNMPNQNIGHAYVLTAIYFSYDSNNKKVPYKVVLRDPWPNNPSKTVLGWSDFYNRINCVTHVTF